MFTFQPIGNPLLKLQPTWVCTQYFFVPLFFAEMNTAWNELFWVPHLCVTCRDIKGQIKNCLYLQRWKPITRAILRRSYSLSYIDWEKACICWGSKRGCNRNKFCRHTAIQNTKMSQNCLDPKQTLRGRSGVAREIPCMDGARGFWIFVIGAPLLPKATLAGWRTKVRKRVWDKSFFLQARAFSDCKNSR